MQRVDNRCSIDQWFLNFLKLLTGTIFIFFFAHCRAPPKRILGPLMAAQSHKLAVRIGWNCFALHKLFYLTATHATWPRGLDREKFSTAYCIYIRID